MLEINLDALGVTEIDGSHVVGGEMFGWGPVIAGLLIAAGAAVMRDWDDFTKELKQGYAAGSSGRW